MKEGYIRFFERGNSSLPPTKYPRMTSNLLSGGYWCWLLDHCNAAGESLGGGEDGLGTLRLQTLDRLDRLARAGVTSTPKNTELPSHFAQSRQLHKSTAGAWLQFPLPLTLFKS